MVILGMLIAGPVSGAVLGAAALYASTREDLPPNKNSHQFEALDEFSYPTFSWTGLFRSCGSKSRFSIPKGRSFFFGGG